MASSSNKPSKLDASFNADDVRVVADLFATFTEGDSEKLLSRVLFDEFGRLLEEKFNQFQASKDELKDSIKRNFGENLVPRTPKRHKPAALLLERIQRFKMVSFMSEEHSLADSVVEEETRGVEKEIVVTERVLLKPAAPSATGATRPATRRAGKPLILEGTVASSAKPRKGGGKKVWQQQAGNPSTPVSSQVVSSHEKKFPSTTGTPLAPTTAAIDGYDAPADAVDPYRMEEGGDGGIEVGASAKSSQQKGRKKKRVPFTPVEKPQTSVFAIKKGIRSTVRPLVSQSGTKRVRSSSAAARKKSQQLRKFEEKAQLALKHKEELLKDKVERAKRDREERRLRVEQNNRVKEAEQKEREHQIRAQEERLREFRLEQERAAQQPGAAKSPGPVSHQPYHPQHPNLRLNRVPSIASSASSTAKSQQTFANAAAAIVGAMAEKTPNSKQPAHGSMARPMFPKPVVFRSGITLSSQKAVTHTKALAAASPSARVNKQPQPVPLNVATPPPMTVTPIGADPVRSKLIASAAGSTTPYPHRIDTGNRHEQRGDEEMTDGGARPKTTPKLVTPRQIAVPPKKSSQETAVTATEKNVAVVEPLAKRKPALTARQREAEKLKLEKEMKAVREREEALRQYQRLEEVRKKREEEDRRRAMAAEEEERLTLERAKQAEESEKRRIREAVEEAERELAKKREALLAASGANAASNASAGHKNSPFLPPGLLKSLAHVSVVESVDGESTQDAEEIMVFATVQKEEIIVREVEVEKSYDGSISDDLTSSITEISPPTSANNAKLKPAMAPPKWHPNGKDGRDKENKDNVCASGSGKANMPPHKFPAPSVLKPAAIKQVLNQSTYDMTPDKVFLPSTKDNYNVDDLSSNDETDNEDHPRKDVPKWAQRMNLIREQAILRRLLTTQQIAHHFGRIRTPYLPEIFPQARKNFNDHSIPLAWSSPLSDPTPGEARFLLFQNDLDTNAER